MVDDVRVVIAISAILAVPVARGGLGLVDAFVREPMSSGNRLVFAAAMVVSWVLTAGRFGGRLELLPFLVLAAVLVTQSTIDLYEHRLPREISYGGTAISLAFMLLIAVYRGTSTSVLYAIVGAVLATGVLGLMFVASRGGMGDGDVRLAPLLGLHLGYLGVANVVVGLFVGVLLAALVGVALLVFTKAGRKSEIPYGPFLALGALAVVWCGNPLTMLIAN